MVMGYVQAQVMRMWQGLEKFNEQGLRSIIETDNQRQGGGGNGVLQLPRNIQQQQQLQKIADDITRIEDYMADLSRPLNEVLMRLDEGGITEEELDECISEARDLQDALDEIYKESIQPELEKLHTKKTKLEMELALTPTAISAAQDALKRSYEDDGLSGMKGGIVVEPNPESQDFFGKTRSKQLKRTIEIEKRYSVNPESKDFFGKTRPHQLKRRIPTPTAPTITTSVTLAVNPEFLAEKAKDKMVENGQNWRDVVLGPAVDALRGLDNPLKEGATGGEMADDILGRIQGLSTLSPFGKLVGDLMGDAFSLTKEICGSETGTKDWSKDTAVEKGLNITCGILATFLDTATLAGQAGNIEKHFHFEEGSLKKLHAIDGVTGGTVGIWAQNIAGAFKGGLDTSYDGNHIAALANETNEVNAPDPKFKAIVRIVIDLLKGISDTQKSKILKMARSLESKNVEEKQEAFKELADFVTGLLIVFSGNGLILPEAAQKTIKNVVRQGINKDIISRELITDIAIGVKEGVRILL